MEFPESVAIPSRHPQAPLRFELWEYDEGQSGAAELFDDVIPLMRDDLLAALQGAGVDNLQTFPVLLADPRANRVLENYCAVNIVGLIRCADVEKSQYDDIGGIGVITLGFRRLVIDERKAAGALFFRLAESVCSIIVHEKVKDALPPSKFPYLKFRQLA